MSKRACKSEQHAISPRAMKCGSECDRLYGEKINISSVRGLMIELESEEEFSTLEPCLALLEECGALMDDAILADSMQ